MENEKTWTEKLIEKIKPEKLYTISEVSAILCVHENTIRARIHEKRPDKPRMGYIFDGMYRIPGSVIINYIRKYSFFDN